MSVPIFCVDALTERPFAGNPAAVCILSEEPEARYHCLQMKYEGQERRFARWFCSACRSPRFAPIPADETLKCPICYKAVAFDPRKHSRRDPADRGRRPDEMLPQA